MTPPVKLVSQDFHLRIYHSVNHFFVLFCFLQGSGSRRTFTKGHESWNESPETMVQRGTHLQAQDSYLEAQFRSSSLGRINRGQA